MFNLTNHQIQSRPSPVCGLGRLFTAVLTLLVCFGASTQAQQQEKPAHEQDVIRVTTELVQSDVMIFDKRGHFVDGLKPEQFQLLLDGKPQTVLFFERVAAGTNRETAQLKALARSKKPSAVSNTPTNSESEVDRARTIFFFVDDTHLTPQGIVRARKAVLSFVENQMRQNDRVAVVSSSGQIGFLQQLTDNKAVLREAVSRLTDKRDIEGYTGKTRISEYMASQIENFHDRGLFAYLMDSTKLEQQMGAGTRHGDHRTAAAYSAAPYLNNRLRQIQAQSKANAVATLLTLRSLLSSSSELPGRKLVFFVSDGFLVDQQDMKTADLLRKVTEAASQTGAVIYSIDLADTSASSLVDVSANNYVDFSGRTASLLMRETSANREPLQAMADQTGGRILLNPDSIGEGMQQALDETADYYLLAWRPENSGQRSSKARLNVTVKDHPEWHVRLRQKFYLPQPEPITKAKADVIPAEAKPVVELQSALGALYPRGTTPVQMSVGYVNAPGTNPTLKVSMQLDPRLFVAEPENQNRKVDLDVLGAAVDDRGKIVTFKQVVSISPETLQKQEPVIWHQQLSVPPGLYQVRLAVRDRELGRTGSAMDWIEVPDFTKPHFEMSSVFIGSRQPVTAATNPGSPQAITVSVDHHFSPGSILRFQTYVYGATKTAEKPEVELQAEVLRNGRVVFVAPWAAVPAPVASDSLSLSYWAELPLNQLAAGRYLLRLTAIDRLTQKQVSQQIHFTID